MPEVRCSKLITHFPILVLLRCLSRRDNLDADSLARCQEHTEELIKDFEFEDLWDQYGIVKQLVVRFLLPGTIRA